MADGFSADAIYALIDAAALGSARPLGATLIFSAFAWGRLQTGVIRAAFALALALPALVSHPPPAEAGAFLPLLLKELALGFALGALASLPLEAIGLAGYIVDTIRGVAHLPGPTGDNTPLGQLFMIIALWMFAQFGGFFRFADMIYQSYGLWPQMRMLPPFQASSLAGLLKAVEGMIVQAASLAGALVAILLMTDFTLLIASQIGRKMNVLDLSQTVKSLVTLAALPFYALMVARVVTGRLPEMFNVNWLRLAFP